MPKISILVPVYNVEKYISACLKSLVEQDYEDYDILVINDGSPFGEQKIIDEFVKEYPDKVLSFIKENGNYGSVLEFGFAHTDAEYVLICDSDDTLKPDALSTLMKLKEDSGAQMVVSAKNYVYEDGSPAQYDPSYAKGFGKIESGLKYDKGSEGFGLFYFLDSSPHGKLYPRDLVSGISYPHKISFTDTLLYYNALDHCDSVAYTDKALADYLFARSGNTMTDLKPKVIDDLHIVYKRITEECDSDRDMYWFFLFDGFMEMYYKISSVNASDDLKKEKYEMIYDILETCLPKRDVICQKIDQYYVTDGSSLKKQKKKLLSKSSKKMYRAMYSYRLDPSFINKIKVYLCLYLG